MQNYSKWISPLIFNILSTSCLHRATLSLVSLPWTGWGSTGSFVMWSSSPGWWQYQLIKWSSPLSVHTSMLCSTVHTNNINRAYQISYLLLCFMVDNNHLSFGMDILPTNHQFNCNPIPDYSVFLDDMAEKNLKDITIHDVDPLALTLLVDFSYTGELSVCEDNVQVDRADRSPVSRRR